MGNLNKRRLGKHIFIAMMCIAVFACETTQGTFEEFTRDGEVIYVGTADTVLVGAGFNKLRFWVAINADPKIIKGKLTTINQSINHEFDLIRTQNGKDTITFDLDIQEGEYTFGLFLMDANGNTSVRREVSAKVYGESYQSGLVNRGLTEIETFVEGAAFNWLEASANMITTKLTYEDKNGEMHTVEVSNEESRTVVDSYKLGGKVTIKSSFKPTPISIEDFDAIPSERAFPDDYVLEKSLISALRLPGDASDGCYESNYERLTDGSVAEYWHSCDILEDQYPFIMSFDLGVKTKITRFKLDERQDCCGGRSPSAYQIWATNDLSLGETMNIDEVGLESWETDAKLKGWVKLVDQVGNQNSTFVVDIPSLDNAYKYVRFVGVSAIDGASITNFNELTFWGK